MVAAPGNEKELVEFAIEGDFDSFAALYTCYLDAIYRYIYYRIGDSQDAEDLTEQVFLKAWEALPNYRPAGYSFINWLYRIAHNIVVDYHRRRRLINTDILRSETVQADRTQDSALESVILAEETTSLANAIGRLPDDYQQVIILRFIEGLGHMEIARILDKSEVACRGIQHRALAFLNKVLTGEQERV